MVFTHDFMSKIEFLFCRAFLCKMDKKICLTIVKTAKLTEKSNFKEFDVEGTVAILDFSKGLTHDLGSKFKVTVLDGQLRLPCFNKYAFLNFFCITRILWVMSIGHRAIGII